MVHGGAWDIPDDQVQDHIDGCRRAAELGYEVLMAGGTALDAVEQAVSLLEDEPVFDAGRGSVLNQRGKVEMDAMIMDGSTLKSGAVAAIQHVLHPVQVARKIMERTSFAMLVGEGATDFALEQGFRRCSEEELLVGRELEDYREFLRTGVLRTREHFAGQGADTVGACALDRDGHVAAATSTGGIPRKLPGRVGDSPLIGSGAYADDEVGAVSATGWGEKIMSVLLSKTALDLLEESHDPSSACASAIGVLHRRVSGYGGIIMVTNDGQVGYHHNTPRMAVAFVEGCSGRKNAAIRA
ncbi:MAG: isoaspartyl peptidase/L-asparaginase [Thermoplasmata archaeon]